jgi:VanZ family protein
MKFLLFLKPIIWLAIICYGLFTPPGNLPQTALFKIPHFDKLVHFGLFFVFCLLLFRPFKELKKNHLLLAPFISLILAAALESAQHIITSSRSSNVYDFIANAAGIITAAVVFQLLIANRSREKYF